MVIAHGSAGIQTKEQVRWVPLLNRMGIATLLVDSFTARGIRRTDEDQAQLDQAANDADAFAALRLLASDSRIDPQRIGVIGFSRGGIVALETAVEQFRGGIIDDNVRFAAHIAFYPGCGLRYWRTPSPLTGARIMMALAGKDDYVPPAPCLAFADAMRAAGQDIEVHVYADAYHDFDNTVEYVKRGERVETSKHCADREIDPVTWRFRLLKSGETFTDYATFAARLGKCVTRGDVTTGSNASAARQAEHDVRAFLKRVFKLKIG
ncbi:MAG: Dienelactone hydrolase [Massilia sp.]|nr:Dienelactone hydrolase [Massilia sp.]